MRKVVLFIILLVFTIVGCERNQNNEGITSDMGISIAIGQSIIIGSNDIDFYDFSAHLIYLKGDNSFLSKISPYSQFIVMADGEEIYTGQLLPLFSSWVPSDPVIYQTPLFYNDYIVQIDFTQFFDELWIPNPDPRGDPRIAEALRSSNQFRSGITCQIVSITYASTSSLSLRLKLYNDDTIGYYYLDPGKMGINLFHYFTNGLNLWGTDNRNYVNSIVPEHPLERNEWDIGWLSVIGAKESRDITITYNHFDSIPNGHYLAFFAYPGLSNQVARDELEQKYGRVWLGEMAAQLSIEINRFSE